MAFRASRALFSSPSRSRRARRRSRRTARLVFECVATASASGLRAVVALPDEGVSVGANPPLRPARPGGGATATTRDARLEPLRGAQRHCLLSLSIGRLPTHVTLPLLLPVRGSVRRSCISCSALDLKKPSNRAEGAPRSRLRGPAGRPLPEDEMLNDRPESQLATSTVRHDRAMLDCVRHTPGRRWPTRSRSAWRGTVEEKR